MVRVAADEKKLKVDCIYTNNVPQLIIIDEQRYRQVLLNLLQNALKFTMEGSIIVTVDYNPFNGYLAVTVTDTGLGISEADQKKLFNLFGKLNVSAGMNTAGIGLGLNICKTICQVFKGEITVSS